MTARRHNLLSQRTFGHSTWSVSVRYLAALLLICTSFASAQGVKFDLSAELSARNQSGKRGKYPPNTVRELPRPVMKNSQKPAHFPLAVPQKQLRSVSSQAVPQFNVLPIPRVPEIVQVQVIAPPEVPAESAPPTRPTIELPPAFPQPMLDQNGPKAAPATIPPIPLEKLDDDFELAIPIQTAPGQDVELNTEDGKITLTARGAPLTTVLELIAEQSNLNLVASEDVTGVVSVTLKKVSLEAALNVILNVNGYSWNRQNDIIVVTKLSTESSSLPGIQGRVVRVFDLDFLAATDVQTVITGLLSPIGKSFVIESSPVDKRRTQEQLVVEDLPEYVTRIEQYLCQADVAPKQVLIEAHILQIELSDDMRHGVDFAAILARIDGAQIGLNTQGFTNLNNSPGFFLGIDGTDLDVVVEALQATTDSKTLASPKVLVVNGQEARIQIGAQLGFLVTTTTQTSTLQQVDFLDTGVVMTVTPHVTAENQILMTVKPEVSTGIINPVTGLPEEETTEVETTVMLGDGKGMVIGGLIQEVDIENQSKIPLVGDLYKVGRLFQKRTTERQRNEIVIALVPRLVPVQTEYTYGLEEEMARATSPLLGPHLESIDRRPLEPELPDAYLNPRRLTWAPIRNFFRHPKPPVPMPPRQEIPPLEGDRTIRGLYLRDPAMMGGNLQPSSASVGRFYHSPLLIPPSPASEPQQ